MISADLLKDVLRLKLRIGEEVIGMLPESVRGHVAERRQEILRTIMEVCAEKLETEDREAPDLTSVPIQ